MYTCFDNVLVTAKNDGCRRATRSRRRRHWARRAQRHEALHTPVGGGGRGARVTGRAPLPVGDPSHARAHAHDASSEGSEWDDDVLGDAATTTCSGRPAARRDGDSNAGSHAALRIFLAAKLHAERRSSGGAAFIHRPPTFLTARNCVCYVWRRTMFGGCNRGFNFFWEVSKAPPSPIRNMHTPRLTVCASDR